MIFALVALIVFFEIFTEGARYTSSNVINLFIGNYYILILAIGIVLVIIAGRFNLSSARRGLRRRLVALFIRNSECPGTSAS